jgi:hypothetical protein
VHFKIRGAEIFIAEAIYWILSLFHQITIWFSSQDLRWAVLHLPRAPDSVVAETPVLQRSSQLSVRPCWGCGAIIVCGGPSDQARSSSKRSNPRCNDTEPYRFNRPALMGTQMVWNTSLITSEQANESECTSKAGLDGYCTFEGLDLTSPSVPCWVQLVRHALVFGIEMYLSLQLATCLSSSIKPLSYPITVRANDSTIQTSAISLTGSTLPHSSAQVTEEISFFSPTTAAAALVKQHDTKSNLPSRGPPFFKRGITTEEEFLESLQGTTNQQSCNSKWSSNLALYGYFSPQPLCTAQYRRHVKGFLSSMRLRPKFRTWGLSLSSIVRFETKKFDLTGLVSWTIGCQYSQQHRPYKPEVGRISYSLDSAGNLQLTSTTLVSSRCLVYIPLF